MFFSLHGGRGYHRCLSPVCKLQRHRPAAHSIGPGPGLSQGDPPRPGRALPQSSRVPFVPLLPGSPLSARLPPNDSTAGTTRIGALSTHWEPRSPCRPWPEGLGHRTFSHIPQGLTCLIYGTGPSTRHLCQVPAAAVINDLKLGGLPQEPSTLSQFWRPEAEIKVSAGRAPSGSSRGPIPRLSQLLVAAGIHRLAAASAQPLPPSSHTFCSCVCGQSSSAPLTNTPVTVFRAQ